MVPDALQFLTYMAGCTERVQLGTMVVVLPWHDPVRVAEGVAMLDNLSGGRVILGIGRGLGRVEFGGFGVVDGRVARRGSSRARSSCSKGSRRAACNIEGIYYQQSSARPAAGTVQVVPRSHLRVGGEPGVGADHGRPRCRHHDRAAEAVGSGHARARRVPQPRTARRAATEPPPPASAGWVFCDPDEGRARELGEQYVGRYYETVIDHYEFTSDHLADTKGYEYYGRLSGYLDKYGTAPAIKAFTDLHVIGTPKQCIDKIEDIRRMVGNDMFMAVCAYGDMAPERVRAQPAALRLRRDAGGQAARVTT